MKKFNIIIFIALLSIFGTADAQDFIYKNSGERLAVDIVEVGKTEITYTEFGNPSRELRFMSLSQVSTILYKDGTLKQYENHKEVTDDGFNRNLISFHLADMVVSNFTLSYEHILASGKMGILIPVAFGYGSGPEVNGLKNKFYSGISLNFYPTGQGKVRYVLGPGLRFGTAKTDINNGNGSTNEDTFYTKFMVNNGMLITPIESLSLSIVGSLGIVYKEKVNPGSDEVQTTGAFTFMISYRF